MTDKDITARVQTEIATLKQKATDLDWKYRFTHHSGTTTFDMLDEIERVRKREAELEDALRVMGEFKQIKSLYVLDNTILHRKMGTYIYLSCKSCNEYIHIGKTSGSDFEVTYEKLKQFLIKHNVSNGCSLVTLNDSVGDFEYDFCMQGDEFE